MEVVYHPLAQRDVVEILRYYRSVSPKLADEFHQELRDTIEHAGANPLRFPAAGQGFHRANMTRFPYHVIYEVQTGIVRVMIVRHHKRHPRYGTERH